MIVLAGSNKLVLGVEVEWGGGGGAAVNTVPDTVGTVVALACSYTVLVSRARPSYTKREKGSGLVERVALLCPHIENHTLPIRSQKRSHMTLLECCARLIRMRYALAIHAAVRKWWFASN
jgi:hypothetical protein